MRICLVSRELAPFHGSGIGVYALEAARAWSAAGHDVHVVTGDHPGMMGRVAQVLPGVRVHAVDEVEGLGASLPEPRGAVLWPLVAYERLWRLHERERFEYVEFADFGGEGHFAVQGRRLLPGTPRGLPGAVLGVRLHMPSELINHANRRTWLGRQRVYVGHMEREAIANADVVFAPCRAMVGALRRMGVEVADSPARPVVVSHNPNVPVVEGTRSTAATSSSEREGGVAEVVFVGRLERRKGPDVLVRAAIDLVRARPGVRVRLIGGDTDTGPLDASVHEWVGSMIPPDLRDRIVLDGQRPREEAVAAMAGASVVCFPAWWDNWPYAVLEAMSLGACVVASDSGGHAEMVQDGETGLLFPSGDDAALGRAIERALDDDGLRRRLGGAAREAAARLGDPGAFARLTTETIAGVRGVRGEVPPSGVPRGEITVVIPHKDMARELPEALASLDRQTIRGFTVIVVDDESEREDARAMLDALERGGGDRAAYSLRVIRRSAEEARRLGLRGPAAARNAGIAASATPLVVTLDADDLLAPEHLEMCARAMAANPDLACVGTLVSYFDESPERPIGAWAPLGLVRDLLPAMNTMGTGSGIMYRRGALGRVRGGSVGVEGGPFDPTMAGYEDWELYAAMAARGMRGSVVPAMLTHYRVRKGSRYHGQDRLKHDRLAAELAARHPALAERADVALRLMIGELRARQLPLAARVRKLRRLRKRLERENQRLRDRVDRLRAALDAERDGRPWLKEVGREGVSSVTGAGLAGSAHERPLRYRAADRAARALRRAGLSGAARRVLLRLARKG